MDRKGGCCIARYTDGSGSSGGGTYPTYDMSKIDRIMLKYRPIAPKPTTAGGGSTSPRDVISSTATTTAIIKGTGSKPTKSTGRGRRKYNSTTTKGAGANSGANSSGSSKRSNSTNNGRKRKSCSPEGGGGGGGNSCGERLSSTGKIHQQQGNTSSYDHPIPSPIQKQKVVSETTLLPLLPESPDLSFKNQKQTTNEGHPIWLNFGNPKEATVVPHNKNTTSNNNIDGTAAASPIITNYVQSPPPTVSSVITVECITDTWVNDGNDDLTDEQKRMSLEKDTCPGFISDTWNRVHWTNQAYKKMIMGSNQLEDDTGKGRDQQGGGLSCGVLMVMGERVVVPLNYKAFTCKVKLQYYSSHDVKKRRVMATTLPCDVWRLENGFVWRLDVNAALSLGM